APVAEVIVSLLGTATVPPSLPSFRRAMATTLECEEWRVSELLAPLVDVGLVRPLLAYDACRPHAVDSLLATARALDCPDLHAECELLASAAARLRTVAEPPAH